MLVLGAVLLASAAQAKDTPAEEAERGPYDKTRATKGVVLLSVNWGRAWEYCGFENVQLRRIGFDRMPVQKAGNEPKADLALDGPGLTAKPGFVDYALLIDPGTYALTSFLIKAAKSVDDVGGFDVGRAQLLKDGQPLAGSFDVAAGEAVYIGHFAPECPRSGEPTVWRYYTKGRDAFADHLAKIGKKYPFLDLTSAQFRLFRTTTIGESYELP